jgi:hypothetical protein
MKVTIPQDLPETPDHFKIAAGEWEAPPATLLHIGHRQPRSVPGYVLRRKSESGWALIDIPEDSFDAYVTEGKIIIQQEGETMETTTAPGKICAALVKAQKAFGPALKTSTNPHYKSKYADLGACVEAVVGGLNANGIALIQTTRECADGVIVITNFVHESGEVFSAGELRVPAPRQDPQGFGSALTYARRYSLMTACGIAPEDDDGNSASGNGKNPAALQKTAPVQSHDDGLRHAEPTPPPPVPATNEATPAQKKKIYAMATEKFGTKEKALEFIAWCKGEEEHWTKKMASDLFDAFEEQAALFADSQR